MLKITAFKFQDNDIFYDAMTGQPIENFMGYVMIYFDSGQIIFKTGMTNGERYWHAEGNKPKIDFIFAYPQDVD